MSKDEEIKVIERSIKRLPTGTLEEKYAINGKLVSLEECLIRYKDILSKDENSKEAKEYSDKVMTAIKYASLAFIPIIGVALVSLIAIYSIKKNMDKQ